VRLQARQQSQARRISACKGADMNYKYAAGIAIIVLIIGWTLFSYW
jgi:hypothetical protein